jgi:hypothetical protein
MDEIATWLKATRRHPGAAVDDSCSPGRSFRLYLPVQETVEAVAKEDRFRLPYETAQTIARGRTGALWLIVLTLILEIRGVGLGGICA